MAFYRYLLSSIWSPLRVVKIALKCKQNVFKQQLLGTPKQFTLQFVFHWEFLRFFRDEAAKAKRRLPLTNGYASCDITRWAIFQGKCIGKRKRNKDEKLQSATQRDATRPDEAQRLHNPETRVERGQKAGPSGYERVAGDQRGMWGGTVRQTGAKQIIQQMS